MITISDTAFGIIVIGTLLMVCYVKRLSERSAYWRGYGTGYGAGPGGYEDGYQDGYETAREDAFANGELVVLFPEETRDA